MTDQQYAYPFDPTGESSDNLIVKESHVISPPDYTDFYFVVPSVGPFFEHNLKVQHWPSGRILVNGVDFILSYKFLGASRATAKPVYGAISILDRVLSGVLEVTYQTLGGPWTIDEQKAAEMLSNAANNPRRTTWEQVVELPYAFPVIDHEWDLVDLVGASDLKDSIDRITDVLLDQSAGGSTGDAHVANRDNPHQVTKAQVGLGSVDNYATASVTEASDPSINNRFMTPMRVSQLIDSYIAGRLDGHIANEENPHNVTKTQVGLSNVPNYRMADATEAVDPAVDNRFVTPKTVHDAIQFVAINALDAHKSDTDNPHQVTKAQVGLDRVENYGIASDTVARDGSSQIHYLTPHGAQQLLNAKVGEGVGDHVASRDNPHQVTKSQVGLGNVPNFPMADATSAVAGTVQDQFMSPYHTKLLIESLISDANDSLVDLISDHTSDFNNPHQVTKAQVGLASVQNYDVATSADAIAGTRADLYMTPAVSADLVNDRITDAFTGFVAEDSQRLEGLSLEQVTELIAGTVSVHITELRSDITLLSQTVTTNQQTFEDHQSNTSNPHQVTKAQVGLGSVDNYATASVLEAQEGTATNRFMTPALVAAAISSQSSQALDAHIGDLDNPHQVTKAQVGLGSVQNYPMATDAQVQSTTFNAGYMSPRTTHLLVDNSISEALTALQSDVLDPGFTNLGNRVDGVETTLQSHVNNTSNPHNVTKAQVGLGAVENYGIASQFEAVDPAVTNRYMTPARVSQAISAYVDTTFTDLEEGLQALGGQLTSHLDDFSNPHQVTKAQVGLEFVENFSVASETEASDATVSNRYMTPQRTAQAIASNAQSINAQLQALEDAAENIVETTPYSIYLPEHPDAGVRYQKVAEAIVPNAMMDTLLGTAFTMFSGEYRVVDGNTGQAIIQHVTVRTNPTTGNLTVKEVGILDEIEPVFLARLDRGASETVFTVWRKVLEQSALGRIIVIDRYGSVELTPDALFETAAPVGAVGSEVYSIGFSYRLAATIEEEFGLLAQELESIN